MNYLFYKGMKNFLQNYQWILLSFSTFFYLDLFVIIDHKIDCAVVKGKGRVPLK